MVTDIISKIKTPEDLRLAGLACLIKTKGLGWWESTIDNLEDDPETIDQFIKDGEKALELFGEFFD